jgi:glycyl-radical enzyme activating protein
MNETALVYDIQRASLHDGPGIRTTIFLKGCPLDCLWCHNPEAIATKRQLLFHYDKCKQCADCERVCDEDVHHLNKGIHTIDYDKCTLCGKCVEACNSNALKITGKEMGIEEVMPEIMADHDFYTNSGGGMTLSGGEPLFHFPFSMELLKQSQEAGVHTCVETSGFVSTRQFKQVLPYVDLLLYDYKVTGSDNHKKYTGVANKRILANLDLAYHLGVPIILRCPIVPGINDTEQHFTAICSLDKRYPNLKGIEILPYHTMGNSKRTSIGINETLTHLDTVPTETVDQWIVQFRQMGCEKAKIG